MLEAENLKDKGEPVKVYVRIRPELSTDPAKNNIIVPLDEKTVKIMPPDGVYGHRKSVSAMDDKIYTFDKVFTSNSSQEDIYEYVADHVLETIRGYNTTIFAYGATGSGKSFTMTGNKMEPGIIPRAIGDLFRHIENAAAVENDAFFYVRLSYVELYNNNFRNLLENASKEIFNRLSHNSGITASLFSDLDDFDSSSGAFSNQSASSSATYKLPGVTPVSVRGDKIEVRESQSAGVFLAGPNLRIPVTSAQEAFQLIAKGNKLRAVGSTQCNDVSSRSHAILTFHVESKVSVASSQSSVDGGVKSELRLGKIHLVDLAGSERLTLSGAEGSMLLETQNINLSLTALGDVLAALSKNAAIMQQQQKILANSGKSDVLDSPRKMPTLVPVPYRNSKLTHLLKDSLGGNSKTIMITNIRTGGEYFQQTDISLMYASRAKKVRNRSLVNRNVIGDTGIHTVNSEIERLKKSLEDRSLEFDKLRLVQMRDAKENSTLRNRLQELNETIEMERKQLENQVSTVIHSHEGHIAAQRQKIAMLQSALQEELTLSQNRIAEQEKEIKWLKQALDESVQVSLSQPQMQSQVESLQTQAKQSYTELTKVLQQAEELKALNASLTVRLNESETARRAGTVALETMQKEKTSLQSELAGEKQKRAEYEVRLRRLGEQMQEVEAAIAQKDHLVRQKEAQILQIESQVRELTEKNRSMEGERFTQKHRYISLKEKASELEAEKKRLTDLLESSVSSLENAMSEKLKLSQQQLEHATDQLTRQKSEFEGVEMQLSQKQEILQREQLRSSQLQAKVDQLQNEVVEANQRLQTINSQHNQREEDISNRLRTTEEHNSKLKMHESELKDVVNKLMNAVQQAELKAEQKVQKLKQQMVEEFDKIMSEKNLQHKKEMEDYTQKNNATLVDLEKSRDSRIRELENKIAEDEIRFQNQLRNAQTKAEQMIDEEIRGGMQTLEHQHQNALNEAQKSFTQRLQDQRDELEKGFEKEKQQLLLKQEIEREELLRREQESRSIDLEQLKQRHSNSKLAIENDFMKEKESLVAKWTHETEALQAKLLQCDQNAQSNARIISSLEKNISELQSELQQKKRQNEELVASLNADAAAKLGARDNEWENKLRALTDKANKQCQQISNEAAAKLSNRDMEWDKILQAKEAEIVQSRKLLQAKDHEVDQLNVLLAASESKQTKEVREVSETLRTQLQEQYEGRIKSMMSDEKDSLKRALDAQQNDLRQRHENEMQIMKSKLSQENLKTISELQSKHALELEDTMAIQRQSASVEIRQIRCSLEEALRSLSDKETILLAQSNSQKEEVAKFEDIISNLKQEVKRSMEFTQTLENRHLEDIQSLKQQYQQKERQLQHDFDQFRLEKQSLESEHQKELSELMEKHLQEIARQRKTIEAAHLKTVGSLNEELALVNEKYNEAIAQSAIRHSQDNAKVTQEQRARFEEHQQRLEEALATKNEELDQLKEQHRQAMMSREEELDRKCVKIVTELTERHTRELEEARVIYDESLKAQLRQLSAAHTGEVSAVIAEQMQKLQESEFQNQSMRDAAILLEKQIQILRKQLESQLEDTEMQLAKCLNENNLIVSNLEKNHLDAMQKLHAIMVTKDTEFSSQTNEHLAEVKRKNDEIESLKVKQERLLQQIQEMESSLVDQQLQHQAAVETMRFNLENQERNASNAQKLMKESFENEFCSAQMIYEEKIRNISTAHSGDVQTLMLELNENHEKAIKYLRTEMDQRYDEMCTDLNEANDRLRLDYENQLEDLRNELSRLISSKDMALEECRSKDIELERLRQFHIDTLASERAEFDDEVQKLKESSIRERDTILSKLRESHAVELDRLNVENNLVVASFQQQIEGLHQKLRSDLAEINLHHDEHVQTLVKNLEAERCTILELIETHKKELKDVEFTVRSEMQAVSNSLLDSKELIWKDVFAKQETEINHLKDTLESLKHEKSENENNWTSQSSQFIQQLEDMKVYHSNQLQDATVENKRRLVEVENSLNDSHQQELAELKNEFNCKLGDMKSQQKVAEEILKESQENCQRLHQQLENELRAEEELRVQISSLTFELSEKENFIKELEQKVTSAEASIQASVDELCDLRSKHQREIEDLKSRVHDTTSRFSSDVTLLQEKVVGLENKLRQGIMTNESLQEDLRRQEKLNDDTKALYRQQMDEQHALKQKEVNELRQQVAKVLSEGELERNRLRETFADELHEQEDALLDQYESRMSSLRDDLKKEYWQQIDELKARHRKELEQATADGRKRADQMQSRVDAVEEKISETEVVVKELHRQLVKANSQRELLQQEVHAVSMERDSLLDRINTLEIDSSDALSKAKLAAHQQLLQERTRLEDVQRTKLNELQSELTDRNKADNALNARITQLEMELSSSKLLAKSAEEDRDRIESMFKLLVSEREAAHEADLKKSLEEQRDELQSGYLKLIQDQVQSLTKLVHTQSSSYSATQTDEMNSRFLDLVKDLPNLWRQKHAADISNMFHSVPVLFDSDIVLPSKESSEHAVSSSQEETITIAVKSKPHIPKTPLHILADQSTESSRPSPIRQQSKPLVNGFHRHQTTTSSIKFNSGKVVDVNNSGYFDSDGENSPNGHIKPSHSHTRSHSLQQLPWSSPSLRSSPTDQLVAAILDGDVQGVRTVIRSKGDDLRCVFWRDIAKSVLPLHRAVSGLHFHGNEKLLISTVESLTSLGAEINATDHAGNTVLHKAIQVCTSKNVTAIVTTLLAKGANASVKNKDGDTPLHAECSRVRTASADVIASLVSAGADVNCRNAYKANITPLTLVLVRGTAVGTTSSNLQGEMSPESNRVSQEGSKSISRRVWIKAAAVLIRAGSVWDPNWRSSTSADEAISTVGLGLGLGQMHLLMAAFPPHRDDMAAYRQLLKSSFEHGLSPLSEDLQGRSALKWLLDRMARTPLAACPDCARMLQWVLQSIKSNNSVVVGGLEEGMDDMVPHSCLAAVRPLLSEYLQSVGDSNRSYAQPPPEKPQKSLSEWVLEGSSASSVTSISNNNNYSSREAVVKVQALSDGLQGYLSLDHRTKNNHNDRKNESNGSMSSYNNHRSHNNREPHKVAPSQRSNGLHNYRS